MVAYGMEKSGLGMTLLMLRMWEPCGEDRSVISLFFPEHFRVVIPIGLMQNTGIGGLLNWTVINSSLTSWANRVSTVWGSVRADWRLWQVWEVSGSTSIPGWKPCVKPDTVYLNEFVEQWWGHLPWRVCWGAVLVILRAWLDCGGRYFWHEYPSSWKLGHYMRKRDVS